MLVEQMGNAGAEPLEGHMQEHAVHSLASTLKLSLHCVVGVARCLCTPHQTPLQFVGMSSKQLIMDLR